MVVVGETLTLPFTATLPTLLLILTFAAPVVAQDNSEVWPAEIVEGEAEKRTTDGFEAPTVTVTVAVTVAPAPVAVRV